ncbi:hypothetical protein J2W98_001961 [Paenibacillus peoriae]|uniref:Uncharacterized protein n=2 Tax=Paenibacillus TaxID=44249 RepID=A0ABX2ZAT5_PAEPO|nr:hypothetical protein [Paenibacillus peoriae]ODA08572.1 hypothetical protein A7312_03995 [Paenibacillus polymyxa]
MVARQVARPTAECAPVVLTEQGWTVACRFKSSMVGEVIAGIGEEGLSVAVSSTGVGSIIGVPGLIGSVL